MPRTKFGLPGIYNASSLSLTDGEGVALAVNSSGVLLVAPASGASFGSSTTDESTFTEGSTTGSIAMGYYKSSADTLSTGQTAAVAIDVNRNLMVTQATLLAGEDLTNNVMKAEAQYSPSGVLLTDTQVKASAGFVHTVTISQNDAAPTAGTIDIYNNTAGSGTKIFTWTLTTAVFTPFTVILDQVCSTGIYVDFTTTADVAVSISYR